MTSRQIKLVENFVRREVRKSLKESSEKYVKWFETSQGKATGMIQLTIGKDSTGEPMVNFSSQDAGIHANEIDDVIKALQEFKKKLVR